MDEHSIKELLSESRVIKSGKTENKNPRQGKVKDDNIAMYISNLSWRQMSCLDRTISVLMCDKSPELINYYKHAKAIA